MREHGGFMVDGRQVSTTLQCCHCNAHKLKADMGGFCRGCMGPTCKTDACMKCYPFEKQLEVLERAILKRNAVNSMLPSG